MRDRFCIFCKCGLNEKPLVEITYTMPTGRNKEIIYQIHLTCAYKYLKELDNLNNEEIELLNLLSTKYNKQMICESLDGIG